MPPIQDYQQYLLRTDYSILLLLMATALCVGIVIILWRRWLRFHDIGRLTPIALLLAFNGATPLMGAVSGAASLVALHRERIRLPKISLKTILFIAALLRIPDLFDTFWYDEAFTQRITTLSLPQLWPAIRADVHPPLFYSFTWLWARLVGLPIQIVGHQEFWLRLPSLAFGLFSIYLLYRLVIAVGLSERVALITAFLCAITPSSIYYSTELRMYAMLLCAVFGALICIFEDRPKLFVVCVALIAWLHNLGLMYVPVICLAAVIYHFRDMTYRELHFPFPRPLPANQWIQLQGYDLVQLRPRWRWPLTAVAACLLAALWLPLALQQSHAISDGFWITFDAGTPFWTFIFNLMYVPREFILPLLLPYFALLCFGFYSARHWLRTLPGALLLMILFGVPAIAILISLVWAPVYLARTFLPLTLLALIPLAIAIDRLERIVLPIAAPLLLCSLVVFYGTVHLIRPDYQSMIDQGCAGATAVYYTAIDTAFTIAPDTKLPSLVWSGGTDRGQTFLPGEMPLFNFQEGSINQLAGQTVCVPYIFTPRTLQPERDLIQTLLATYPHITHEYDVDSELQVDVYELRVP